MERLPSGRLLFKASRYFSFFHHGSCPLLYDTIINWHLLSISPLFMGYIRYITNYEYGKI